MDKSPEKSAVSISWFVVADLLVGFESPQSTHPDIISRIGRVNDARAAWQQVGISLSPVERLPTDAKVRRRW